VGQILAKLDDLHLSEDTLVVFTSDNGPWVGGNTGSLRGMKATTWEGGYRVPCIARWPRRIRAGKECRDLAGTFDLFATALAATGATTPADLTIDGGNLEAVWRSESDRSERVLLGQSGNQIACVRDSRWKLFLIDGRDLPIDEGWVNPVRVDGVTLLAPHAQPNGNEYPGVRAGDVTKAGSLFDLSTDPAEQHDVAVEHPDVVARLRAELRALGPPN
jgi:arylsulfatase A-like enzyme